jgi:toxin ParE1/3/4
MAKVIWSEPALQQLDAIAEYIALDKPDAAAAVIREIFRVTDEVETFLKLGRRVKEVTDLRYRQIWIKPCVIYYRTDEDRIFVLHVRRGEQHFNLENILWD